MNRSEKSETIKRLREELQKAKSIILVDFRGMDCKESKLLRDEAFRAGVKFEVVKNTFLRIAVSGTPFESISHFLQGPTAVAHCQRDEVTAAKVVVDFSKGREFFKLKCGYMNGKILNTDEISSLASLPGIDTMRARLLSVMRAPVRNLMSVLLGVQLKFIKILEAIRDMKEGPQG